MRICFLVDLMNSGGAERVASVLCNEFSKTEDVTLVMIGSSSDDSFYPLDSNIKVVALLSNINKHCGFIKKVGLLRSHFLLNRYDVLISFLPNVNICTYLANRKFHIPHIVSERNDPHSDPHNIIKRKIKEFVFSRADGVVLQTHDAEKFYKKICSSKKIVIKNPLFSFDSNINRESVIGDNRVIYVGRLEKQKNIPMLIEAFKLFSKTHEEAVLEIYGSGTLENKLKKVVFSNGLDEKIFFMGNTSNWVEKVINCALFVNCSLFEGMPNSLLEAVCYGIPSIATNCPIGGSKEIIRDRQNGFLCPVGDVVRLSSLMGDLYHNYDTVHKFIENSKTMNELFAKDKVASEWLNFIREIVAK